MSIKASIGSKALRKFHSEILVHTGQHFDDYMSKVFFDELGISTVASKLHMLILQVEAGNRLGDLYNYEEINKIVADYLSTLRLVAIKEMYNNLTKNAKK